MNNMPTSVFMGEFPFIADSKAQKVWDARMAEERVIPSPPRTILSVLKNSKEYSIFYSLVKKSRMESFLDESDRHLTLFVAPDSSYPPNILPMLDAHEAQHLVRLSLVTGFIPVENFFNTTQYVQTLAKVPLYINGISQPGNVFINQPLYGNGEETPTGSYYMPRIVYPNITAVNGIIHILSLPLVNRE